MAVSFHIENFGCRAARADGEAVRDRLRVSGLVEGGHDLADVVVVNTCSVTAEADRAARAYIRRAHRLNPEARIVVTGCYAQRAPEEVAGLGGVAAVVGNSHKALAPAIVLGLIAVEKPDLTGAGGLLPVASLLAKAEPGQAPIWADDRFAHSFLEEAQLTPGEQTRPNLKIQEGCGNRCTFCVIPQTRGSSRSLRADAIVRQVDGFVAAGGNELVLSGINLGRWGRDLRTDVSHSQTSFSGLVRRIFSETALPRLRLSSIEPMDWDADLISLFREFGGTRLARHAHLPLQSGSDAVLRRMHRRYRPWHYASRVAALTDAVGPDLTLGADVMVGFPGETHREFRETCDFVQQMPFGYLHLFPFSPRPGTPGLVLHAESPVATDVVEERMATLRVLAKKKTAEHRMRFVGRELNAITLHSVPSPGARGRTDALTENFIPVEIGGRFAANRLIRLIVTSIKADLSLEAELGGSADAARAEVTAAVPQ